MSESIQGQLDYCQEQPGVMSDIPAGQGLEQDDPQGTFQPKPSCVSLINTVIPGVLPPLLMDSAFAC